MVRDPKDAIEDFEDRLRMRESIIAPKAGDEEVEDRMDRLENRVDGLENRVSSLYMVIGVVSSFLLLFAFILGAVII